MFIPLGTLCPEFNRIPGRMLNFHRQIRNWFSLLLTIFGPFIRKCDLVYEYEFAASTDSTVTPHKFSENVTRRSA